MKTILAYILTLLHISNPFAEKASEKNVHVIHGKKMVRMEIPELTPEQKKIVARITFYHNHQDSYGSKTASGKKARQGITVAAHPDFKFGTKLTIPKMKSVLGDAEFVVQDRGTAVTRKTASKKKCYVFDIYITARSAREGDRLIKKYSTLLGEYASVYVHKS